MAVVLGLLVALSYGTGDFLGGLAAKRSPAMTVVIGSFALSTVLVTVITGVWLVVGTPPTPTDQDLWLGAVAGLVGPVSLGLLYYGLATGRMSIVAPITAVVAATVPLVWGMVAGGERPSRLALGGVAVALVAVGLISSAPTHEDHPEDAAETPLRRVVPLATLSGLGFGVLYVALGNTSDDAGLWPLVVARPTAVAATVTAATLVAWHGRRSIADAVVARRGSWPLVAGAGALDITANAIYLSAANTGLLSIVGVLSSLYPATTVVLARIVLAERLHRLQLIGLVLAALGVAAIASG